MSQVQTSVEFSVELHRFINVDLFQRGFYQVRATLRTSPRLPSKVEVLIDSSGTAVGGSTARSPAPLASTLGHYLLNAYVINGQTAVSKTFQILYKNEEIILDDIVTFRVFSLVDGHRVKEQLSRGDFQLLVELWFTDQSFSDLGLHRRLQCVSSRQLVLHFDALRGLHHHMPLVFDYFHLSGVSITIHASLVALCQPAQGCGIAQWFGSSPRSRKLQAALLANQPNGITMESVYFPPQRMCTLFQSRLALHEADPSKANRPLGMPLIGGVKKAIRQQRACLIHWEICLLMLSACSSLERRLVEYLRMLSPWQQLALDQLEALQLNANLSESLSELARLCIDYLKVAKHQAPPWEKLFDVAKNIPSDDDFLMLANNDIAQLCGALLVLWQQFLRVSLRQERVKQQLARQRHAARVKRFGEAYFIIEKPRSAITAVCDAGSSLFTEVTEALRRSTYLNSIPPLDIECPEVDGDTNTLPIIYEEHYQEFKATLASSSTSSALASPVPAAAGIVQDQAVEARRSGADSEITVQDLLMKLNQHSNSAKKCLKSRFLRQLRKGSRYRTSSASTDAINNSESMPDLSLYTGSTGLHQRERSDLAALNLNVGAALAGDPGADNSTSSAESSTNNSLKEEAKKKHHRKKIKHRRSISSSLVFAKLLQSGIQSAVSRKDSFDDSVFIQQAPSSVSTSSTTTSTMTSSGYGGSSTPPGTPLPPEAFRDGGSACVRGGGGGGRGEHRCHSDPQSQRGSQSGSPPAEASRASDTSGSSTTRDDSENINSPEELDLVVQAKPSAGQLKGSQQKQKGSLDKTLNEVLIANGEKAELRSKDDEDSSKVGDSVTLTANGNVGDSGEDKVFISEAKPTGTKATANLSCNGHNNNNDDEKKVCVNKTVPPTERQPAQVKAELAKVKPDQKVVEKPGKSSSVEQASGRETKKESYVLEKANQPRQDEGSSAAKDTVSASKNDGRPANKASLGGPPALKNVLEAKVKAQRPSTKQINQGTDEKAKCSETTESTRNSGHCAMAVEGTLFFPRPPKEFSEEGETPVDKGGTGDAKPKTTQPIAREAVNGVERAEKSRQKTPETVGSAGPDGPLESKADQESGSAPRERLAKSPVQMTSGKATRPSPLACSPLIDGNESQQVGSYLDAKCTIMEMLTDLQSKSVVSRMVPGASLHSGLLCDLDESEEDNGSVGVRRASAIGSDLLAFVQAKEDFRQQINLPTWLWCSDFPSLASTIPYFSCDPDLKAFSPDGLHLVICVHGLDGNSADLRLVRTYLELGLPTVNFEFLMSERNQGETFESFDTLTDRLVGEIIYYIQIYDLKPNRISFIGHSLGNIIIRSALTRPQLKPYLKKLHTFLSLSGPHLGTLFNSSGLVNMGMWFMQKWKKSGSLLQLAMRDAPDIRSTFLYRLAQSGGLEHFKHVLLFGSSQDRYVPIHSARIELCKAAMKDSTNLGAAYREMVHNLLGPVMARSGKSCQFVRFDVHHALPTNTANSLIGRAAHIAVLDSELFIEKFMVVTGLKYFS